MTSSHDSSDQTDDIIIELTDIVEEGKPVSTADEELSPVYAKPGVDVYADDDLDVDDFFMDAPAQSTTAIQNQLETDLESLLAPEEPPSSEENALDDFLGEDDMLFSKDDPTPSGIDQTVTKNSGAESSNISVSPELDLESDEFSLELALPEKSPADPKITEDLELELPAMPDASEAPAVEESPDAPSSPEAPKSASTEASDALQLDLPTEEQSAQIADKDAPNFELPELTAPPVLPELLDVLPKEELPTGSVSEENTGQIPNLETRLAALENRLDTFDEEHQADHLRTLQTDMEELRMQNSVPKILREEFRAQIAPLTQRICLVEEHQASKTALNSGEIIKALPLDPGQIPFAESLRSALLDEVDARLTENTQEGLNQITDSLQTMGRRLDTLEEQSATPDIPTQQILENLPVDPALLPFTATLKKELLTEFQNIVTPAFENMEKSHLALQESLQNLQEKFPLDLQQTISQQEAELSNLRQRLEKKDQELTLLRQELKDYVEQAVPRAAARVIREEITALMRDIEVE